MVSWMVYMACSRNVDLRVCSDDVADLASRFFTLFIAFYYLVIIMIIMVIFK